MTTDVPAPGWTVPTTGARPRRPSLAELWPVAGGVPGRRILTGALLSGLLAATMIGVVPGLGLVVNTAAALVAFWPARARRGFRLVGFTALAWLLVLPVLWIDATWIVVLDLLAAAALFAIGLIPGSTWSTVLSAPLVWPLAALRGSWWIGAGVARLVPVRRVRRDHLVSWVLSVGGALLGLVVFASLFGSADPAFARLMSIATPEINVGLMPVRVVVFALAAVGVLSAGYLTIAAPRVDKLHPRRVWVAETREWLVPVVALVALFTAFVAVQFAVLFAGDEHILRTAGLTYASYARQGFGQLVVVSVLTLLIIGAVSRWAPTDTQLQRVLLRVTMGLMCLLTLVIVASALRRLQLYDQAYGLTRLRMFAVALAGWIGAVFVLVMIAGVRLQGSWVPHASAASAGLALVLLTAANPDALIARSAVARYHHTGRIDMSYLSTLSADAVPAVASLPSGVRLCTLSSMAPGPGDWRSVNWSRARARGLVRDTLVSDGLAADSCSVSR